MYRPPQNPAHARNLARGRNAAKRLLSGESCDAAEWQQMADACYQRTTIVWTGVGPATLMWPLHGATSSTLSTSPLPN